MFKYVKFTKVETDTTVLEFRGSDDTVKVNNFSDNEEFAVSVVSVEAEIEADIDALVESQPIEIGCTVIGKDEFKALVTNSAQLKRIRDVVKEQIALKYDTSDEIALIKKDTNDVKRVTYEEYVQDCLSAGYALKMEIGY